MNILKKLLMECFAVIDACQYCERSNGLYKYGAVYEKDIKDFGEYRG